MRTVILCLALSGMSSALMAQETPVAPAPATPAAPATSLPLITPAVPPPLDQTTGTNKLTLQDAVELALKNNLDVQIERFNPRLAQYNLNALYGGYDPTLNLAGQHDYSKQGPRLLSGGFTLPGNQTDDDNFSGNLTGLTPWGMTYRLQGNAIDSYGRSSGLDTNNNIFTSAFENSVASTSIQVTQPLLRNLLIDNTRFNILVAKNRLKYSELNFKQVVMNTVANTEQAYYNLIYAREFVVVQQKAVELALRLVEENRKRVQVGAIAPLDEQQAESQAASSRADLINALSNLGTQERVLKTLITDRYSTLVTNTIMPSEPLLAPRQFFSRQDSWSKGLSLRPDYLQAKLDVDRAGIQVKYTKNQLLPEVDAFATYGYNGSGKEFSDSLGDVSSTDRPFYTFGGQLSVPLANTTARNNYRSSKASEEQSILSLKRLEQVIMVQIDNAVGVAESRFHQVEATRIAREYAEAALNAEEKKLASGKSTTYTVLQMQRDLTSARGNEIQALANYNDSLSQLSLYEGSILERRGINLEVK